MAGWERAQIDSYNAFWFYFELICDNIIYRQITHYILMLYQVSYYILHYIHYIFPIICGFISIFGACFWSDLASTHYQLRGPYVTLGISIVVHGAWCTGSRGSEGKNDSPVEKTYGNKKQVTTTIYFSRLLVLFCGTFFQCSIFWGGGFSKVSNGIGFLFFFIAGSKVDGSEALFTQMMWGTTGVLTTHDPGTQDPDFVGSW